MLDFASARARMVERQIVRRGVKDANVVRAMSTVPREAFVGDDLREFAYDDTPLPIEEGQTISQPYIVAAMIEAAALRPGDRVLEIGAGSGYAAGIMAEIGCHVWTIERHQALAETARHRLSGLGYSDVQVHVGDGTLGWKEAAPYNAILAAAAGPAIPETWQEQLAVGGRLLMPRGDRASRQRLIKVTKTGPKTYEEEDLGDVMFVPLIGALGWNGDGSMSQPVKEARPQQEPSIPELLREAAEPLPDFDDPAFGRMFDGSPMRGAPRRSEPWHLGILPRSRCHHERLIEARLHHRRSRGRLAGCGAHRPYVRYRPSPEARVAFGAFRPGCGGMTRSRTSSIGCAIITRHRRGPALRFLGLDIYSLNASIRAVLEYLDKVDPEAARTQEALRLPHALANDPATYGRAVSPGKKAMRKAFCPTPGPRRQTPRIHASSMRDQFLDAVQNAKIVRRPSVITGSCTRARRKVGTCVTAYVRDARRASWRHAGTVKSRRLGAQFPYRQRRRHRDGLEGEFNIGELCREPIAIKRRWSGFGTDPARSLHERLGSADAGQTGAAVTRRQP